MNGRGICNGTFQCKSTVQEIGLETFQEIGFRTENFPLEIRILTFYTHPFIYVNINTRYYIVFVSLSSDYSAGKYSPLHLVTPSYELTVKSAWQITDPPLSLFIGLRWHYYFGRTNEQTLQTYPQRRDYYLGEITITYTIWFNRSRRSRTEHYTCNYTPFCE